MTGKIKAFTESIFYQIELTARYSKMLGVQLFGKLGIALTPEEFSVLDVVSVHKDLCQRDLAKLILKDRANTGKLLDTLESKGFIVRELAVKNNRPVKIIQITQAGIEIYQDTYAKLAPHHRALQQSIQNTDLEKVGELLIELREVLEDTIDIDI